MNYPENLTKLIQAVLNRKPVLKQIYQNGNQPIAEYIANSLTRQSPTSKKEELIQTYQEEVTKRLGEQAGQEAGAQLSKYYQLTTAHHHHATSHPFFFNWDIVNSIIYGQHANPILKNVLVLGCANVTMSNSSFPRGHIYHNQHGEVSHLSLIPSTQSQACIYNTKAYTPKDLERVKQSNFDLDSKRRQTLNQIIDEVYGSDQVLNQKYYTDQITVSNFLLWQKYFKFSKPIGLIYITQEDLVSQLLIKHHIEESTDIHKIIFGPQYENLIKKYFNGIIGCFNLQKQTGTYLFWGTPDEHNRRVGLIKENDFLVSLDGNYKLELTPQAIKQALNNGQIIPGMMLTFMVLSFYYGLKCLGGFDQPNYLTQMKQAFVAMQTEAGNIESANYAAKTITNELGGDFVLALLKHNNKLSPATCLDLILEEDKNSLAILNEQMYHITIQEAILPLLPEFYQMTYSSEEQDKDLAQIKADDVLELSGLGKKIKPCIVK